MKFLNSSSIPTPFLCPGTWKGNVSLFTYSINALNKGVSFWSKLYKKYTFFQVIDKFFLEWKYRYFIKIVYAEL